MNEFKFVKKVKIERGRGHKLLYTGVEMRMYLCKDIMYISLTLKQQDRTGTCK